MLSPADGSLSVAHVREEENPSGFLTKASPADKTETSIRYALGAPLNLKRAPEGKTEAACMHT